MSARIADDEFVLKATLPDILVATLRKRTRRLAHLVDQPFSVWRRSATGAMPQLQRIGTTTACGRTIAYATTDGPLDDLPSCPDCWRTVRQPLLSGEVDF